MPKVALSSSFRPRVVPIWKSNCQDCVQEKVEIQGLRSCSGDVIESLSRLGLTNNSVSSNFANWVISLPNDAETEDSSNKREALEVEWALSRRLYHCIEVHIKNALDYQKYKHATAVLQAKIFSFRRHVEALSKASAACHSDRDALLCHLSEINEVVKEAQKNANTLQELHELSDSIFPVHLRLQPVQNPIPVQMICPFSDGIVRLVAGEELLLVNNSSPKLWKLRREEDDAVEINVPAVAVLIPSPDRQSVESVQRLSGQMNDVWKAHGDAWTVKILWLTLQVLLSISNSTDCQHAGCEETDSLLRSLSVLDGVLSLADGSETRDDILHQVYQIRDVLFENRSSVTHSVASSCSQSKRMLSQLSDIYSALQVEPSGCCGLQLLIASNIEESDADQILLNDDGESPELSQAMPVPVEVSVETHQESAQASSIRASVQEVRQTFSIEAVLDPFCDRFISIQEAVEKGIIDSSSGTYRNAYSDIILPIPDAMSRGLILVEGMKTMATREQSASMGVLEVTISRETRPYTVCHAFHPVSERMIPVQEAIQAGIFSPATGTYTNTETDEELDVEAAIDSGLLLIDYDESVPRGDPIVTKKCFAVYSVIDRSDNVRLTFSQAEKRGIIDAETGQFTDNLTRQTMHLSKALGKGYVRARAFADMESLEFWVARRAGRRGSTASSLSTLSGWSQASSELLARANRN